MTFKFTLKSLSAIIYFTYRYNCCQKNTMKNIAPKLNDDKRMSSQVHEAKIVENIRNFWAQYQHNRLTAKKVSLERQT